MKSKVTSKKRKFLLLIVLIILIALIIKSLYTIGKNIAGRDYNDESSLRYLESISETAPDITQNRPNIIVILTDDLGYSDVSAYGSSAIETPHIDSLAEEGALLTEYYAPSPVCTPSRASLLTGRYPVRTLLPNIVAPDRSAHDFLLRAAGAYSYGVTGIPEDELLIPEVLRATGYATGMLGKWHLGDTEGHIPNDNGFDSFYGALYSNDMNPYAIYRDRDVEIEAPVDQNALTMKFTEEATSFIEENKDKPFFLYYAQPFPHHPVHASESFQGTSDAGLYGDAVEEVDWSVGQIMNKLDELGLTEDTIIIFTSDNGPWHQGNPGFNRGRKGLNYEGGQKVPFIISWPGTIPEGEVIEAMSMGIDVFPTILDVVGIPLPEDRIIDGENMMPLLMGETDESLHDEVYFFKSKDIVAVRQDDWKYHLRNNSDNSLYWMLKDGPNLYNLETDPQESYNMIEHEADLAADLDTKIAQMEESLAENLRGWKK